MRFQVDSSILPHLPYAQPDGVVFGVWQSGKWGSWVFTSSASLYDQAAGTFVFSRGGFQESRGSGSGGNFYVENVMEELDWPSEVGVCVLRLQSVKCVRGFCDADLCTRTSGVGVFRAMGCARVFSCRVMVQGGGMWRGRWLCKNNI